MGKLSKLNILEALFWIAIAGLFFWLYFYI
jgi:hypothetical protein